MIRTIHLLLSMTLLLSQRALLAQVGISGPPHPSAVLDLKSPANDKAFYPPRLNSAQRQAIPNPQVGAFVYDLDKSTMYLFDGQNWLPLLTTVPNLLSPTSRTASNGAVGDIFGYSVSISGNYAIVGASAFISNDSQGAVYIFVRSGSSWTQQRIADNSTAKTRNGDSVGLSNGTYIIGGPSYQNAQGKVSFGTVN